MATKIDALTETHIEDLHDEAFFRAAAMCALTELPDLQAVLLFGSRGRGTARSDSDWDLALITNSDCARSPRELAYAASTTALGQRSVEMIVLSEQELRAKCNIAGTMARTVLLTSRLLAGHLPDVGEIEAVARMDARTFKKRVRSVCDELNTAAWKFSIALDRMDPEDLVESEGRSFIAASANAAEHLAKLMIDLRDVRFANTHNLNALANDLERGSDGQWPDTVRKIRDMNGGTSVHHQASYAEIDPPVSEDMHHAVCRVGLVARYLVEECQDVAEDISNPELADSGKWALRYLSMEAAGAAELLRKKSPASRVALDSLDEYAVTADAFLAGYDTMLSMFDGLAAMRPDGRAEPIRILPQLLYVDSD